jgi:hypothetical protein
MAEERDIEKDVNELIDEFGRAVEETMEVVTDIFVQALTKTLIRKTATLILQAATPVRRPGRRRGKQNLLPSRNWNRASVNKSAYGSCCIH